MICGAEHILIGRVYYAGWDAYIQRYTDPEEVGDIFIGPTNFFKLTKVYEVLGKWRNARYHVCYKDIL